MTIGSSGSRLQGQGAHYHGLKTIHVASFGREDGGGGGEGRGGSVVVEMTRERNKYQSHPIVMFTTPGCHRTDMYYFGRSGHLSPSLFVPSFFFAVSFIFVDVGVVL